MSCVHGQPPAAAQPQRSAGRPPAARSVDDFYYEHHVVGNPMMDHGWGDAVARQGMPMPTQTLRQSYELFGTLRERGVRAHSWV